MHKRIARMALVACLVATPALAAPTAPAPGGTEDLAVEPAAAQLLRAALERVAAAASFAYTAEITNESTLPSGQKIQYAGRLETAVRRPDGLRASFQGERRSTRSWFDGKSFTLLDTGQNVYACSQGPARLEEFLDGMKERLGFTPPLSLLLHEHVAATALGAVKTGFTVGAAEIGGIPTTHLAFTGENTDWQVWVSEDAGPVIRRIVITYKKEVAVPQFSATFLAWDFAPALGENAFAFAPPPGAMQCDFKALQR